MAANDTKQVDKDKAGGPPAQAEASEITQSAFEFDPALSTAVRKNSAAG